MEEHWQKYGCPHLPLLYFPKELSPRNPRKNYLGDKPVFLPPAAKFRYYGPMPETRSEIRGGANSALEIADNLKQHVFFHGTDSASDVGKMLREGFRRDFVDEEGHWFRDGHLGVGIYLSCNWHTALWFGSILLRATLKKGTKVVDTSVPPDRAILGYLSREFGREILTAASPRKVLPKNKHLALDEFVAMLRFHYQHTWENWTRRDKADKWPPKRRLHAKALSSYAKLLPRYGFHGYGHPSDDNGIVIFQPEQIVIEDVVLDIPFEAHFELIDPEKKPDITLSQLKRRFPGRIERFRAMDPRV